jgi:hypothetical protein
LRLLGVTPVELPGSHCPHVSRPVEVAEILSGVAGGLTNYSLKAADSSQRGDELHGDWHWLLKLPYPR